LNASSHPLESPLERAFSAACADVFSPLLLSHGFTPGAARLDPASCQQEYCAGALYIVVSISSDPREPPPYSNVVLGEGSLEWPDRDWNSVALWRLARDCGGEDAASLGTYPLSDGSLTQALPTDLVPLFARMRDDIISVASSFLRGDLRAFRRSRALQARARSPYLIHRPDGHGGYVSSVDPASAKLKEQFSVENPA
jgi:hypothetical protein